MMTRTLTLAVCAAAIALASGSAINASTFDKTTYVTFSEAVTIPGSTLAPGTYIFERVTADNSLVRVMSRDRSHVYLTQFTHTIARPAGMAASRPAVTFGEAAGGSAEPVRAWYPANSSTGQEFVYR